MKRRGSKGNGTEARRPQQPNPYMPAGEVQDWQLSGYHMERQPADDMPPAMPGEDSYELEELPAELPLDVMDVDPSGENGEDPSIENLRSDDVKNHNGDFWKNVQTFTDRLRPVQGAVTGDQPAASSASMPQTAARSGPMQTARGRAGSHVPMLVVVVLCVIAVAAWITTGAMRIQQITVEGNSIVSDAEVIRLAGIRVGGSLLSVNHDRMAASIGENRYLRLRAESVEEGHVTLHVIEREPVAYTVVLGIYYSMDSSGMVLEEYSDASQLGNLVCADRLAVTSCVVGRTITLEQPETLEAYHMLMLEVKAMSLQGVVKELYLDQLDNICMTTTDGYYVRMGDSTYLHGKLRAMMLTRAELYRLDEHGGTIDVSVRERPTYSPPAEDKEYVWAAIE